MSKSIVVIVGGGIAGLAAATRLVQCGYDIHLLEASPRLGGRVHNADFPGGKTVPLGGCYFHGEEENSLFKLANQLELVNAADRVVLSDSRKNETDYTANGESLEGKDDENDTLYLLSDGERLNFSSSLYHYRRLFQLAYAKLNFVEDDFASTDNVYDYVAAQFNAIAARNVAEDTTISRPVLNCYMSIAGLFFGNKMTKDVDLHSHRENESEQEVTVYYPGYPLQGIVNHLTKGLPSGVIHLNSEVVSIQWDRSISSGNPVMVQCSNGVRYPADHVILTVSLGVLKEKIKTSPTLTQPFFSPPLPRSKQRVIERLGFGVVCKLYFCLPKVLCANEVVEDVLLIWKQDQSVPKKHSWVKGLSYIQVVDSKGLYTAWLAGEDAIAVEQLPEAEVKEGLKFVLEMFFKKIIPQPIAILSTRWHSDPLYRGSYSYSAVGTSLKDREELSAPLSGTTPLQLMFAGEATHPTLFSTANAAYDTGVREAQRIMDLANCQQMLKSKT